MMKDADMTNENGIPLERTSEEDIAQARSVALLARPRIGLASQEMEKVKKASPEVQKAVAKAKEELTIQREIERLAPWERFTTDTDYVVYLIFNPDKPDDIGWLYIEADLATVVQMTDEQKPNLNSVFAVGSGANSQNMRLTDCAGIRLTRESITSPIKASYLAGGAFDDKQTAGISLDRKLEEGEFVSRCKGVLHRFGTVPFATYAGSVSPAHEGAVQSAQTDDAQEVEDPKPTEPETVSQETDAAGDFGGDGDDGGNAGRQSVGESGPISPPAHAFPED